MQQCIFFKQRVQEKLSYKLSKPKEVLVILNWLSFQQMYTFVLFGKPDCASGEKVKCCLKLRLIL